MSLDESLRTLWRQALDGEDVAPELATRILGLDDPVAFVDALVGDLGNASMRETFDAMAPGLALTLVAAAMRRCADDPRRSRELAEHVVRSLRSLADQRRQDAVNTALLEEVFARLARQDTP